MKKLPSTMVEIKNRISGKTLTIQMPVSKPFWKDGERISMEDALKALEEKYECRQMTLGEEFEWWKKQNGTFSENHFDSEEEYFRYFLRKILGSRYEVDEAQYQRFYKAVNSGKTYSVI